MNSVTYSINSKSKVKLLRNWDTGGRQRITSPGSVPFAISHKILEIDGQKLKVNVRTMKYYNLRFRPILYFRFDKYKSPKISMNYAHAYDSMNARSRQTPSIMHANKANNDL